LLIWKLEANCSSATSRSDDSKNLEADITADRTDNQFSKPPQSNMAEEQIFMAILLTGRSLQPLAERRQHPLLDSPRN